MSEKFTPNTSTPQVVLDPENPDKSSGFYFTILLQYYIGMWPSADRPKSKLSTLRKCLIPCQTIRMLYSIYFQYLSMKMVKGDAYTMTEYTMSVVFYVVVSIKMATVYLFRNRFKNILETLESFNKFEVFESKFRTDRVEFSKKWSRFFFSKFAISVLFVFAFSMIQMVPNAYANRMVPFRLYFPYDVKQSPIFELTLVTMFILALLDFTYILFGDLLFMALLLNVATHFAVLRHDIENLQELSQTRLAPKETEETIQDTSEIGKSLCHQQCDLRCLTQIGQISFNCPSISEKVGMIPGLIVVGEVFDEIITDLVRKERKVNDAKVIVVKESKDIEDKRREELCRRSEDLRDEVRFRLGECVKRHQSLIRVTLEIKYLFKYMLALQVFMNVFIGVLALYISTLAKSLDSKVMMISMVLFGGVLEFVLFCWVAENVNDQSLGVATAVYSCSWLEMDVQTQKALKLVLLRSQRACVITAAGIPLSRKTFKAMTKLAYYFHALLTRFYWGEKLLKSPQ